MIRSGDIVYTTRRNPFSNDPSYRKGRVIKIEYCSITDQDLIWCKFKKRVEAFQFDEINSCLFTDLDQMRKQKPYVFSNQERKQQL